jgi:hypothetical protein
MREPNASDAKAHLPQLLDWRQKEIDRAIANIRALREQNGRVTSDELLSARDEGRRDANHDH